MNQPRYHVIFDISNASDVIDDPERLPGFVTEAVSSVGMKILSGPVTCAGVPENPGWTSYAVLDFSHISVHTFTEYQEALIDIFSCKPFDMAVVREVCSRWFINPDSEVREKVVWWG